MSKGGFFAIGAQEFAAACELGMNSAVALLVMARGTGRDNATTAWSALSVFNHSGMARRRAQVAIDALIGAGLVDLLQAGKRPRYKIHKPSDESSLLWLPNELVDGAASEIPPITKLREAGDIDLLQKFVELYGVQDLDGDGGLPRSIAWANFQDREPICPIGQFVLYGFSKEETKASSVGIFADFSGQEDEYRNKGAWIVLSPLWEMGLLEQVYYMAESTSHDAELIYPVGPWGTAQAIDDLLHWLEETGGSGFAIEAQRHAVQGIAPKHIKNAAIVGLYRLRYRPKTGKTSRWLSLEMERAEALVGIVGQICRHETARPVHIKVLQGS